MTLLKTFIHGMRRKAAVLLTLLAPTLLCAGDFGVKTNFVYDATLTPNIAVEFDVARASTIQLGYSLNAWDKDLYNDDAWIKHWMAEAQWRFWRCQTFNGFYFGVYGRGGEFNLNNVRGLLGMPKAFQKGMREEGWYAGGGLTLGYQWLLGKHWNFELGLQLGADYIKYDRYVCGECGDLDARGDTYYVGPTNAVVALIYMF